MADEVFRFIVQGNTADDLARFRTEVDLQFQQFLGFRYFFTGYDFADAEVDLAEIVDSDFRLRRFLGSRAGLSGFLFFFRFGDFFLQIVAREEGVAFADLRISRITAPFLGSRQVGFGKVT